MGDFYEFDELPSRAPYVKAWELRAKTGQNQNLHRVGRIGLLEDGAWASEFSPPGSGIIERKNDHPTKLAALKHIIQRRHEDMAEVLLTYQLRMNELCVKIEEEES